MKKMVALGLVGLAVGLVTPGVFSQAPQPELQKWEQFCEHSWSGRGGHAARQSQSERGSPRKEWI